MGSGGYIAEDMRPVVSQVADAHKSNRFASRMVWKRAETAAGEETRAMPLANSCLCEAAVSLHARHRLVLRIWTRDRRTRYEHVNNDSLQFWNGRGHETPPCLGITRHTSWRSITTCNHHCSRELTVHRRYGCDRIIHLVPSYTQYPGYAAMALQWAPRVQSSFS